MFFFFHPTFAVVSGWASHLSTCRLGLRASSCPPTLILPFHSLILWLALFGVGVIKASSALCFFNRVPKLPSSNVTSLIGLVFFLWCYQPSPPPPPLWDIPPNRSEIFQPSPQDPCVSFPRLFPSFLKPLLLPIAFCVSTPQTFLNFIFDVVVFREQNFPGPALCSVPSFPPAYQGLQRLRQAVPQSFLPPFFPHNMPNSKLSPPPLVQDLFVQKTFGSACPTPPFHSPFYSVSKPTIYFLFSFS